jgi:uncharacterized protein YecA (UPF0149 family)
MSRWSADWSANAAELSVLGPFFKASPPIFHLEFRHMDKEEFNNFKIRYAIYCAKGSLTRAAEALGMPRCDLMELVVRTPEIMETIHDVRQETADHGQVYVREAVEAEAPWALKYVLRTLGANRGYGNQPVESLEMEVGNRESHLFNLNWRLAPDDPLVPVQQVLEEKKGHITRTAKALNKKRSELQKLIDNSPALQMTLFQEREALVDNAEQGLINAVVAKKPWALMFTLNSIRRDTGFGRPRKRRLVAQAAQPVLADPAGRDPKAAAIAPPAVPIEPVDLSAPQEPQPILIGTPAGASGGPPAPEVVAQMAAELLGESRPFANGTCARNSPCPCASGRKFKRCCGA